MRAIAILILIATPALAGFSVNAADIKSVAKASAGEDESLGKLKQDKAELEKRLQEVNAKINKIWAGRGVQFLGMTLMDPTERLLEQYGQRKDSPLPLIAEIHDSSFFPPGMKPYEGCAFWIVEPPANGFLFNQERGARHFPKNVRELVEAIVACTIAPEEFQKLNERTAQAARSRAETMKDDSDERQRLLKIAEWKIAPEDVGKYVCRVVYIYPNTSGTMTTMMRMGGKDLEQLRGMLRK